MGDPEGLSTAGSAVAEARPDLSIAESDRLDRLSLEREVDHIRRTQGEKAARRARRLLTVAIDERRRGLIQQRLEP